MPIPYFSQKRIKLTNEELTSIKHNQLFTQGFRLSFLQSKGGQTENELGQG